MVCPRNLCHQWCHKFIILLSSHLRCIREIFQISVFGASMRFFYLYACSFPRGNDAAFTASFICQYYNILSHERRKKVEKVRVRVREWNGKKSTLPLGLAVARLGRATPCGPYGARPSASGNLTTSSQAHLPMSRDHPQGADTQLETPIKSQSC